jgi:hypothetical protein
MTKGTKGSRTRNLFQELSSGIQAMRDHREGRIDLRRHTVEPAKGYQLKVTLMETDPPIWRRLSVAGDTTLRRLDRVIQTAMGWTNSHLHTFTAGGVLYEYDMGDSWRHQVVVEEVRVESGNAAGPLCLGGERACPPEDSGGVHGYYQTLEILRNPRHEEYQDTKAWIESTTGGPLTVAGRLSARSTALRNRSISTRT